MSGVKDRIRDIQITDKKEERFNRKNSNTYLIGINKVNKVELFAGDMPTDLVLLSAQSYTEDGAVVLLPDY